MYLLEAPAAAAVGNALKVKNILRLFNNFSDTSRYDNIDFSFYVQALIAHCIRPKKVLVRVQKQYHR